MRSALDILATLPPPEPEATPEPRVIRSAESILSGMCDSRAKREEALAKVLGEVPVSASHVRQHLRHNPSGSVTTVAWYDRKDPHQRWAHESGIENPPMPSADPPHYYTDKSKKWTSEDSAKVQQKHIQHAANWIRTLPVEYVENAEWGGPVVRPAKQLVEALEKAPNDTGSKFKKASSFALESDYDRIANVGGVLFGLNKDEDPDDEDAEIWSFERLDDPRRERFFTDSLDNDEAYAAMKRHVSKSLSPDATPSPSVAASQGHPDSLATLSGAGCNHSGGDIPDPSQSRDIPLQASHVREYQRISKTGQTVTVHEHEDKREKHEKQAAPVRELSEKAQRAKDAHHLVDKPMQNYATDNEHKLARQLGGISFPDNEAIDIALPGPSGAVAHGIELKTLLSNKAQKLTMKESAMKRKRAWERKNGARIHTVVLDDQDVYNANGEGKHDLSRRKIFYRRGFGSFRVSKMYQVKSHKELMALMNSPTNKLPKGAR